MQKIKSDVELNVFLTPIPEMRELHWRGKGKWGPTDVLTFREERDVKDAVHQLLFADLHVKVEESNSPMLLKWERAKALEESRRECLFLGDIYICAEYMRRRGHLYPNKCLPFSLYMTCAVVHAVLHALGYNHENIAETMEMVRKEKQIGLKLKSLYRRHRQRLECV